MIEYLTFFLLLAVVIYYIYTQLRVPKADEDVIARSLARQSARYANATIQDANPFIAALHGSYGAAYLFALYENFSPQVITRALRGESAEEFRKKVIGIQDAAFANLMGKCTNVSAGDPLLTKLL